MSQEKSGLLSMLDPQTAIEAHERLSATFGDVGHVSPSGMGVEVNGKIVVKNMSRKSSKKAEMATGSEGVGSKLGYNF